MHMHESPQNDALFRELALVGKAFSSDKRLRLLGLLAQGERSVDDLAAALGLGLTTASSHLQVLRAVGLVAARSDGTRRYYRLAGDDVAALFVALRSVAALRSAGAERALRTLRSEHGADQVGVVTRAELQAIGTDRLRLVDVRPTVEFQAGHLPGALSVPLNDLAQRADELGDGREVVAYCRGAHCVMADDAVAVLADRRIAARRLEDGLIEWKLAGLPVEVGA